MIGRMCGATLSAGAPWRMLPLATTQWKSASLVCTRPAFDAKSTLAMQARALTRGRWQSNTARPPRNDDLLKEALARAKRGRSEALEAARLARIRLASKGMASREGALAINIFKLARDAAGCAAVLRDLQGRGIETSHFHYNPTIAVFTQQKDWRGALELFEEMGRRGVRQDTSTYNATILACEKGWQWQLALELFGEMGRRGG